MLGPYNEAMFDEQHIRESLDRKPEELEDFKVELTRLWKGNFMTFLTALLTIEDDIDVQHRYSEETKELTFRN